MSATRDYPGALPLPPGVTPNIDDGPSALQGAWIAALVVELIFPTVSMCLRVYIRTTLVKKWTKADTVFMVAWALFICEIGLGLSLTRYGVGQHAWNVAPAHFSKYAENLNIQQVIYMPGICSTKIGILLQFREIFVTNKRSARFWIIMGFIIFNIVFFTILFFLEIFQCFPRPKIWNPMIDGKCIDIEATFVATGVINVVDDFAILALPISWVFKLQTSKRRKISISAVFLVGLFACVCSIMRLAESILNLSSSDITVSLVPVSLWATAEISAGLVVACLPYLPRLFNKSGAGSQLANYRIYSLKGFRRAGKSMSTAGDDRSDCHLAFNGQEEGNYSAEIAVPKVPHTDGAGITKTVDITLTSESAV